MTENLAARFTALSDEFHMHIGYAIAQWAHVDDELFRVFQTCVGQPTQCSIIYYKIGSLDTRLSLTSEIVKSHFPRETPGAGGHDAPAIKDWKSIAKDITDSLATRRKIAHNPVSPKSYHNTGFFGGGFGDALFNEAIAIEQWLHLTSARGEKLRNTSKNDEALELEDLKAHTEKVYKIYLAIREFYKIHLKDKSGLYPRQ